MSDAPDGTPEISADDYWLRYANAMGDLWGRLSADPVASEQWFKGELWLRLDNGGPVFYHEETGLTVDSDQWPGGYL